MDPSLDALWRQRDLKEVLDRVTTGRTIAHKDYEKSNGVMQGPNYAITVALAVLSVWTRMLEATLPCETSSFIDDSSMRTTKRILLRRNSQDSQSGD